MSRSQQQLEAQSAMCAESAGTRYEQEDSTQEQQQQQATSRIDQTNTETSAETQTQTQTQTHIETHISNASHSGPTAAVHAKNKQRGPPAHTQHHAELNPEYFAQVFGGAFAMDGATARKPVWKPCVTLPKWCPKLEGDFIVGARVFVCLCVWSSANCWRCLWC